jgi:hypothetical protein
MRPTFQAVYPDEIVHPTCARCGVRMWLMRIEPDEPGREKRTFECEACGRTATQWGKKLRYELTDNEWTVIRPMPDEQRRALEEARKIVDNKIEGPKKLKVPPNIMPP